MNRKYLQAICLVLYSVLFLSGCSLVSNFKQLMFLRQMGENQSKIEKYLERQQKLFELLQKDIENNALERGMFRNEILSKYGDPVFCKEVSDEVDIKEVCLFRNPIEYFDTDKIYLKFDQEGRLCCWDFFQFGKK